MIRCSTVLALVLLATGCAVRSGNLEPGALEDGARESTTKETRSKTPTPDASRDDDGFCRTTPGVSRRDLVCHRWRCEGREGSKAAGWSGDPSSCNAGDLDADAAARALRVLNVHRFLAGVEPVQGETAWTDAAQQCALVAHANAKLSHTPTPDWRCWSPIAALTSSVSLIANRSAPLAIAAFVEDPGNEATMVHRRWLLSETLTRIGLGSTDRYSCLVVDGRTLPVEANGGDASSATASTASEVSAGSEPAPRAWVAWPPAGPVPIDVFSTERLDEMGWTIQTSSDDLDGATVKVSVEGTELPVRTMALTPLLGSRSAIRFVPDGWKTEAGRSYVVRVTGPRELEFTVEPTDCER